MTPEGAIEPRPTPKPRPRPTPPPRPKVDVDKLVQRLVDAYVKATGKQPSELIKKRFIEIAKTL